jgi:hypothetical protein
LIPALDSLDLGPNIYTRDETVSKLAEILDSGNIVHVRGTPASGKSILSLLLRDYYRRHGRTVFRLSSWKQNIDDLDRENPWVNFAQILRHRYPKVEKVEDFFADDNVIILDEAQGTYGDTDFWDHIVKSIRGKVGGYKIKLCLFCSYGSPSAGLPYNRRDHGTPVDFGPAQRISLTPSVEPNSPPIGLFYNKNEFETVVTKLCSTLVEKFSIDTNARNYIFNLTNGHPGAVMSIMGYLHEVCNCSMITCILMVL